MICIVDYGVGNLGAINNMLKYLGVDAVISSDVSMIEAADKLILPGVGSFDYAINQLKRLGLFDVLDREVVVKCKPIIGICLGMQLMTKSSEEGNQAGFGWVDAEVKKFSFENLKVPHMGWNIVEHVNNPLILHGDERFYFVHSYYVECNDLNDVMYSTSYGKKFVSGFRKGNIIGVQFHPEKSHRFGMFLLQKFCEL
ncbi:imidazole glycerol phosphate synthase subunit HisH [Marinomonas foliarum]|uniref:Imidazole glycerol phosphate synthase subunit HisH n=1 Tax=Marinomonas foliarum TaxID=491950 RepID=A0ABX7IS66_9GAMM|nr:imidazole glycerol phosphate synthase subunit HisH [Marinomonas foliarum]QRV25192.1 imidazole glycerol phosphate synthase subunit HisH [Marinomonas foliarum]